MSKRLRIEELPRIEREIVELVMQGRPQAHVAKQVGVSSTVVSTIVRDVEKRTGQKLPRVAWHYTPRKPDTEARIEAMLAREFAPERRCPRCTGDAPKHADFCDLAQGAVLFARKDSGENRGL